MQLVLVRWSIPAASLYRRVPINLGKGVAHANVSAAVSVGLY